MSSRNEPKPMKKRAGRKRLPPLPPGPKLQFVVANHPGEFRSEATMRNVRSHVMYKHRGSSPPESSGERNNKLASATGTPSPTMTSSDGMVEDGNYLVSLGNYDTAWDGDIYRHMPQLPSENLTARVIAAITAEPARSAPPILDQGSEYPFPPQWTIMSQESLNELRDQYIHRLESQLGIQNSIWTRAICNHQLAFLSHLSVTCVYQDIEEGCLEDTPLTMYAKTKVLGMVNEALRTEATRIDDFTIISILHLLTSDLGGRNEGDIDMHQEALMQILDQRGGIANLGMDGNIATFLIL
ncbi:hypothetical protein P280DRAFT_474607 [Massarina eburnea CBS 473.64]|uniref:Uncharacterized protein n=1 Tax=Massarina eburnea CBS 473.64 TaxID=1395130 RepID=A0A6A6RGZ6_9PLEO|nr:hypothetical protein P280DRAFT_474607 [Massarina eburnea CBS 473.64]